MDQVTIIIIIIGFCNIFVKWIDKEKNKFNLCEKFKVQNLQMILSNDIFGIIPLLISLCISCELVLNFFYYKFIFVIEIY